MRDRSRSAEHLDEALDLLDREVDPEAVVPAVTVELVLGDVDAEGVQQPPHLVAVLLEPLLVLPVTPLLLDEPGLLGVSSGAAVGAVIAIYFGLAALSPVAGPLTGIAGAIDEDHRQLAILEDETNRTVVLIDRLLNELSEDLRRQTAYLNAERRNLQTISIAIQNGEILGQSLFNRAFANAGPVDVAPVAGVPGGAPQAAFGTPQIAAGEQALVVIRFDRPNVQYQQPLYNAVAAALERKPTATFDLIAVASAQGNAATMALSLTRARQNAEEVVRTLDRKSTRLNSSH